MRATVLRIVGPAPDLEKAFSVLRQEGAEAIVALEHPAIGANASQIAERARTLNIPSFFARDQAEAGGLFGYGTSLGRAAHAMAHQVTQVLAGEVPADIAIETLCSPELVIDMRTARHLGVTIPPEVLRSAVSELSC